MHKFRAHTLLSMEWQKLYCRSMSAALLFAVAVWGGSVFAQSVADEANKELPAWLRFNGLYRVRFEGFLNRNFAAGQSDDHILNRLRIGLKAQPTSWMKFAFEGQDARIYFNRSVPTAPPHANPMDLRVGYLELGDIDSKPAGLRVGRQELEFGEGRLVGAFNWINVGRSFDAVRATLRHNQYRLDLFASSVVNPASGKFDRRQAENNLHGLFGRVEKLVPGAVIEPYVLWRLAPRQVSEDGVRANLAGQAEQMIFEQPLGRHVAAAPKQDLEHRGLARGKRPHGALDGDLPALGVERHVAEGETRIRTTTCVERLIVSIRHRTTNMG